MKLFFPLGSRLRWAKREALGLIGQVQFEFNSRPLVYRLPGRGSSAWVDDAVRARSDEFIDGPLTRSRRMRELAGASRRPPLMGSGSAPKCPQSQYTPRCPSGEACQRRWSCSSSEFRSVATVGMAGTESGFVAARNLKLTFEKDRVRSGARCIANRPFSA